MPPPEEPNKTVTGEVVDMNPNEQFHRPFNIGGRQGLLEQRPELKDQLCALLQGGNTIATACAIVGITYTSFKEWMQRGEGRATLPQTALYTAFAADIKRARAFSEATRLRRIDEAGKGGGISSVRKTYAPGPDGQPMLVGEEITYIRPQWQADAWYLERSRPQSWGRRQVDVNMRFQPTKPVAEMTDEELLETERRILAGPQSDPELG